VLSVTEIIRLLFIPPAQNPGQVAERMRFGTAVHEAIALQWSGILDLDRLDDRLLPYLDGWQRWRRDMREAAGMAPGCWLSEVRAFSPSPLYAGRCDAVHIAPCDDGHCDLLVCDFKTGSPAFWHDWQLQAYGWALRNLIRERSSGQVRLRLHDVYLDGQGGYRVRAVDASPRTMVDFWHKWSAFVTTAYAVAEHRHCREIDGESGSDVHSQGGIPEHRGTARDCGVHADHHGGGSGAGHRDDPAYQDTPAGGRQDAA